MEQYDYIDCPVDNSPLPVPTWSDEFSLNHYVMLTNKMHFLN